jgi:hypothetical protein
MQLAEGVEMSLDRSPVGYVAVALLAALVCVVLATDSSILARIHSFSEIVLSVLQ